MKARTFILLLSILPIAVFAQTEKDEALQEIQEQVWNPFMSSYGEKDAELFNSVHTTDVLRISPWGIRKGDEYRESIIQSYSRKDQPRQSIDLVFEHQVIREDVSYQVGYYKVTHYKEAGNKHYYGRFHVVIKKEDGQWKIAQDWDSSDINGHKVGEEDFSRLKKDHSP